MGITELNIFLNEHPELKTMQARLEKEMSEVEEHQRIYVIMKHMRYNLEELRVELELLKQVMYGKNKY